MSKFTTRQLVAVSLVAATYASLTIFAPIPQYGEIQLRIAEVLTLLVFINPIFAPGVVLGCFIANLFSTVNPVLDAVFGTLHSAISVFFIARFSKNLVIASLWPTIFSFIIGAMIIIAIGAGWDFMLFATFTGFVMVGQFAAVTIIGVPLFMLLMKNNKLMEILKGI